MTPPPDEREKLVRRWWWLRPTRAEIMEQALADLKRDLATLKEPKP